MIEEASGLSVWDCSPSRVNCAIRLKEQVEADTNDKWRIPYLNKLLCQRQELDYLGLEMKRKAVDNLINSLCIH